MIWDKGFEYIHLISIGFLFAASGDKGGRDQLFTSSGGLVIAGELDYSFKSITKESQTQNLQNNLKHSFGVPICYEEGRSSIWERKLKIWEKMVAVDLVIAVGGPIGGLPVPLRCPGGLKWTLNSG